MKSKIRFISIILILSMIFPTLSGVIQPVFAATELQDVKVVYNNSTATATISWKQVPNITEGKITYHVPSGTGTGVKEEVIQLTSPVPNSVPIPNIKKDIIYDFKITLTDSSGFTYEGSKYFLGGVTVDAKNVEQEAVKMSGGGMETGIYPAIKLFWYMPKVYDGSKMVPIDSVPGLFNADTINFRFKIQLDRMLKDVVVKSDSSGNYVASIDEGGQCNVIKDANGQYSFYLLGRKDENTDISTQPIPDNLVGYQNHIIKYPELLPSTIYKISMISIFYSNSIGGDSGVVTGETQSSIESDYICTRIRFQLTKADADNLYVRVFRVNQKGVSMPNLAYDIQIGYDSSWRSVNNNKINDSDFGNDPAPIIDIIEGEYNLVDYRIVVIEDKILSSVIKYNMKDDLVRPPVPSNIMVNNVELQYPGPNQNTKDTSSKVTITWDYPGDDLWNQIKSQDYYFHFSLSLSEDEEEEPRTPRKIVVNGEEKYFTVKFRDVLSVSANKIDVDRTGTKPRLKYEIDGYNLFKYITKEGDEFELPNMEPENVYQPAQPYPDYLLPNTTYYLKMYTSTKDQRDKEYVKGESFSEKSLTVSFTTLSPASRDVPVPKYLQLVEPPVVIPSNSGVPKEAIVKLRFDQVKVDWKNFIPETDGAGQICYDLYMNTSADSATFAKIGTFNESVGGEGDAEFTLQVDNNTTWVNAKINRFSGTNAAKFGNSLSPNSTYYFYVQVRLILPDGDTKESVKSVLLPVTIPPRGSEEPVDPDDTALRPEAPEDFGIAVDENGDQMLTGQRVTFEWTIRDNKAAYELIATSSRVAPDATTAPGGGIDTDPTYISFIGTFGNKGNDGDGTDLILNPNITPLPGKFELIPQNDGTTKCRYTIDTWLFPNKIYYFSLRALTMENHVVKRSSVWVSIPVTTTLIESPTMLQVVNECVLAFNWYGTLSTDSYEIRLKPVDETEYTVLKKSQYTIVQDSNYYNYARTTKDIKLKPDTEYNIQVVSKVNGVENVINIYRYSSNNYYKTRDDYHEIDIRWQGVAIDPYTEFEIAIKTEDDTDYIVLDNTIDLEQYVDISTHTYPYYIEKSINNVNNGYYTYNARIKSVEVTLPDGTKEHKPLKSNTKYYIKVRAKKTDSINIEAVARSKYAGPVDTRTEFNQDDYDDIDIGDGNTNKFLDMLDELEKNIYWEVNRVNSSINKIYVKDERIVNLLEAPGNYSITVDLSQSPGYVDSEEIYMAKSILDALKRSNKSLIIKLKGIEYTIRPETFDVESMEEFKKASELKGSKDVYLQINNIQSSGIQPVGPENTTAASKMYVLSAQVVASRKTSTAIKDMIKDKLYNEKTGIVQKKLAVLKNPNNSKTKGKPEEVDKYLMQLIDEIKSELSYYIEDTINGTGYLNGAFMEKYSVTKFSSPMAVRMQYKGSTLANPYVIYSSNGNWQKLTMNIKRETGYLSYYVTGTGKYAIFSGKDITSTISDDNPAKEYITKLASNYDLAAVFSGAENSFNAKLTVTVKEAVLLFELISESRVDNQKSVKDKAKMYGIDKIINVSNINRNITRQETAAVVIMLYCQKTGADYGKLKASYKKTITDDNLIGEKYAIPVYACLQMEIMSLDSDSKFNPSSTVNRAEFAMAVEKMLESL